MEQWPGVPTSQCLRAMELSRGGQPHEEAGSSYERRREQVRRAQRSVHHREFVIRRLALSQDSTAIIEAEKQRTSNH